MSCIDMVKEDIDIAKQLIEIDSYKKYLKNREKILTITTSGDQILNSVLAGAKEIDSIDISRSPKYYVKNRRNR